MRGTKPEYLDRIDETLSTGGKVRALWERVSGVSALPDWVHSVVALERQAAEIREYHPLLIPGLLQTEEYAYKTLRAGNPAASSPHIEEQVAARMERQALLSSDEAPLLLVVLDEGILRRPIGGRATMGRQLERLLRASAEERVIVQVIPLETENHPGLDGKFRLIRVPERGEILYLETRISGAPEEDPEAVEHYARVFGELRGAALPIPASRQLIESARGEFQ